MRKPHLLPRVATGIGALIAALLLAYGANAHLFDSHGMVLVGMLAVALAIYTILGASHLSALTGKILIFASTLSLLAIGIDPDTATSHAIMVRLGVLVGGLYLERVNPHRQFAPWMFLAFATKVEFFLIAALIARESEVVTTTHPLHWWLIPISMAIAVPFLAFQYRTSYRILVWITSVLALSLAIVTHPLPAFPAPIILPFIILWPIIIERIIGRRTTTSA